MDDTDFPWWIDDPTVPYPPDVSEALAEAQAETQAELQGAES